MIVIVEETSGVSRFDDCDVLNFPKSHVLINSDINSVIITFHTKRKQIGLGLNKSGAHFICLEGES